MELRYTEDHDLLRKTARRLLAERCPLLEVRKIVDAKASFDRALYREIAELGWLGLPFSAELGGAELDLLALAIVLEEMGRALVPSPLLSSVLAALAIRRAGSAAQASRWLPAILGGKSIATIGLSEPDASWEPEAVTGRAERNGDRFSLTGIKTHVMWGAEADLLVAPFLIEDQRALFALDLTLPGVRIEPEVSIDRTRHTARVVLDRVAVPADARLDGDSAIAALRAIHDTGYVLVAAELLGAGEAVLAITRDYANERVQFGRPIGAFQAVKHPLVDVMIDLEMARSLVVGAAAALDAEAREGERGAGERLARMAKAAATDASLFACDRGIQLHGGFGFTWDCGVHLYYKRALWGAATLGDGRHHRRHLAQMLAVPASSPTGGRAR